jgi:beta-galactosidase
LAGGCIWHWCDQGLYRDAEPGEFAADAGHPIEGKVYLSPERLMDSNGNMGSDGIVYADRRPQVDYWQTRNVFSPVQIAERTLSAQPGRQTIAITVTNRYDFTDLAANRFTWRLFKNREKGLSTSFS